MDRQQSQVQSTMAYWPNTSQLRQRLSLPLALSFCPTAQQSNVASFNDKNLSKYRCQSCKAFINKYCLIRNQNQYDCSLCGFSNHVDQKINLQSTEIKFTSYKCKAAKIQRTIMSKERTFVFILDMSNYSEWSVKFLLYTIHAIREFVNHAIREKKNVKIMLLAFDDGIQLFNIKNQVQRLVFWNDSIGSSANDYPFTTDQVGLLSQCKDNILMILDVLEEEVFSLITKIKQRKFRNDTHSTKIMEVLEYAIKHTKTQSGKIFLVSGLNHELQKFKIMRNYDSTVQDSYKHHFPIVKKQCLTDSLQALLTQTQMTVSFFMHKSLYAVIFQIYSKNLMPFHVISKSTNGELRYYFRNQTEHFFYEFNYLLHQCLYDMKFQTLLRVRSGMGLKLVGIFGNFRTWKGIPEQAELLSCQSNRKFTFEFVIEGRINSPSSVVQFSVLYTDLKANRYFKIVTQKIQLSSQISTILPQINYQTINSTYLKAILHNMDLTPHFRKLQLALQDRCKRHLQILRDTYFENSKKMPSNNQNLINEEYMKNARSHAIFTYMLMQHFLLNLHQKRDIFLDVNIETRSKLATLENPLQIIWPLCYLVTEEGYEVIEMKAQNFSRPSIGIVIDRGDRVEVFLNSQQLRNQIRQAKNYKKAIQDCPQLQNVSQLLSQMEQRQSFPHLQIIIIMQPQYLYSFCIFSIKGAQSFDNFIQTMLQD